MTEKEVLEIIEKAARESWTELDLSGMGIKSLPGKIGELTNLELLNLCNNQLTSVPAELGQLKNLEKVWLQINQLTSVPTELGQLTNLTYLSLHSNHLTSVPAELGQLENLTTLELYHNHLTSVPPELGQLENLEGLFLHNNELMSLPVKLGQLKSLDHLFLAYNQLASIPREIVDLGMEIQWEYKPFRKAVYLEGNPLESPPVEIVKQGTDAVRQYFKSLEAEKRTLNEVKVLLVGKGGAGKTSLVKRLTGRKYDPKELPTAGVDIVNIEDWQIGSGDERIKVHFWDFGGQDIMQATHQMFYSLRSLYILVLNAREDPEPEDWLKHVESFGGDSPILVVINKIDENPNYDVNGRSLKEKFNGIRGFSKLSCRTGEGLEGFSQALQEELANVEMVRTQWGGDWLRVKEELEKSKKDYITYGQYEKSCRQARVTEKQAQRTLLNYLHSLGVILHFEGYDVEHTQVLNPAWVTEAVYRIINSRRLSESKGYLRKQWLGEILKEKQSWTSKLGLKPKPRVYSAQEERYIIDLMGKFELCFELTEDRDTVLVPDLLDEQEPAFDFEDKECVDFYFEYDYLPKSVMPRFMVRRHRDIEGTLCWRTGAVLRDKAFKARAIIRADKQQRRIYIRVSGQQRRDYFSTIRKTFLDINAGFAKLGVRQFIPLDGDDAVEYDELIGHELARRGTIFRGKSGREYEVAELLGRIESRQETQLNINSITGDPHFEVGTKIRGDIVAMGHATVNIEIKIEQAIDHLEQLRKAVEEQPQEKLTTVAKKKALEIMHDALKDIAKRQLTEAAKKILQLGRDVAPVILRTAGYEFFQNML